ncbi:unnamed protein product [Owenia fusiformis]|uniref:Uncharacterized protein n=1 Tax=Owenia fusiformis TaxID=6347 RepID=A0A8J1UU16_OWEFU|nr:unnamed protein product [Owenia fusiformis]
MEMSDEVDANNYSGTGKEKAHTAGTLNLERLREEAVRDTKFERTISQDSGFGDDNKLNRGSVSSTTSADELSGSGSESEPNVPSDSPVNQAPLRKSSASCSSGNLPKIPEESSSEPTCLNSQSIEGQSNTDDVFVDAPSNTNDQENAVKEKPRKTLVDTGTSPCLGHSEDKGKQTIVDTNKINTLYTDPVNTKKSGMEKKHKKESMNKSKAKKPLKPTAPMPPGASWRDYKSIAQGGKGEFRWWENTDSEGEATPKARRSRSPAAADELNTRLGKVAITNDNAPNETKTKKNSPPPLNHRHIPVIRSVRDQRSRSPSPTINCLSILKFRNRLKKSKNKRQPEVPIQPKDTAVTVENLRATPKDTARESEDSGMPHSNSDSDNSVTDTKTKEKQKAEITKKDPMESDESESKLFKELQETKERTVANGGKAVFNWWDDDDDDSKSTDSRESGSSNGSEKHVGRRHSTSSKVGFGLTGSSTAMMRRSHRMRDKPGKLYQLNRYERDYYYNNHGFGERPGQGTERPNVSGYQMYGERKSAKGMSPFGGLSRKEKSYMGSKGAATGGRKSGKRR